MKKTILFCAVAALLSAQTVAAQSNQEVTYVEDPSQGLLFNRMQDNWFITAEGGVNKVMTATNNHRNFWNGVGPAVSLFAGKWISPVFGFRIGANMLFTKQLSATNNMYPTPEIHNGWADNRFNKVGPVAHFMVNIANWIGGYKPSRKWNLIAYAGAGGYWTFLHKYDFTANNVTDAGWENMHDKVLTVQGGLINTIALSKQVDLSLDFRYSFYDAHDGTYIIDPNQMRVNRTTGNLQAYLGLTYKFKKRDWNGPMIPVCPPAEDCSPYVAALDDANAKISELETQLRACLNRPAPKAEPVTTEEEHLATIYFPINVSRLTPQDKRVVASVAAVMQNNPNTRYVVTGWADNYTGNDQINTRLRHARANSVKEELIACGVNPSQFDVTINNANLCDLGEKCVSLDRATTIDEIK